MRFLFFKIDGSTVRMDGRGLLSGTAVVESRSLQDSSVLDPFESVGSEDSGIRIRRWAVFPPKITEYRTLLRPIKIPFNTTVRMGGIAGCVPLMEEGKDPEETGLDVYTDELKLALNELIRTKLNFLHREPFPEEMSDIHEASLQTAQAAAGRDRLHGTLFYFTSESLAHTPLAGIPFKNAWNLGAVINGHAFGRLRQPDKDPVELDVLVHEADFKDVLYHAGEWAGKGRGTRIEGFSLRIDPNIYGLSLEYMVHLEARGDELDGDSLYRRSPNYLGTRGQARRLEAFRIRVTGINAGKYTVQYKAKLAGSGETALFTDDELCGTKGEARAIEAIWVRVVKR